MIIDYLPPCFFHPNSHSLARVLFVFSCVFRCACICGFQNLRIKLRKLLPESTVRCPGFFWDDPTGIGFSPPLFAMLLCAVIALLRTLLDGHFSSSSFFSSPSVCVFRKLRSSANSPEQLTPHARRLSLLYVQQSALPSITSAYHQDIQLPTASHPVVMSWKLFRKTIRFSRKNPKISRYYAVRYSG